MPSFASLFKTIPLSTTREGLTFCVCLFFLWAEFPVHKSCAQGELAYTYKAKNLKPADFGYEDKSWEMTLRKMNDRLDEMPDDPDVLMQRAIAYREYGARRALLLRQRDWRRSRADFEALLALDSTFKDVLYQYGMLLKYEGKFDEALQLMHRQLEIHPESAHTTTALFRLYHQFLHEKDAAEVEAWLKDHPSEYASFFEAELMRKAGRLEAADDRFVALLKTSRNIALHPVLLARARIYYALDKEKIAESFVLQAINIIENNTQARLVLEDFKYILNNQEMEAFLEIEDAFSFRAFFLGIMEKRNPARSEAVNRRLTEHFRRLLEAEKTYATYEAREAYRVGDNASRDRMADNDFPLAYWLNGEFGDKGLIFIRHGTPADKVASVNERTPFIESWRYRSPDMDFHFEGFADLAELIPTLPLDLDVLEAREMWGGVYVRLAAMARQRDRGVRPKQSSQLEMDAIMFENELFDASLAYVDAGMTSDRHQWSAETRHLPMPYFVASFQGGSDSSDVEIYYSVPLGMVSEALKDRSNIDFEVGMAVHDMQWNVIHSSTETLRVGANEAKDAVVVDYLRFTALPDSYHVNFHTRIKGTEWIGSYQFDYAVPDFRERRLMMSDLIPAFEIAPLNRPSRYAKKGLYVRTNPGRGYRSKDPFFIYFEIYNLTFSEDDRTDFEVTYTLQRTGKKAGRKGLFKRRVNEPLLSITYEREGEVLNVAEYGEIDMSAVPAGLYKLIVTISDKNTSTSTSNTQVIELR